MTDNTILCLLISITTFTVMHYRTVLLFLLQQTNSQLYIITVTLYIMYTATCFDISMSPSVSFAFVLAKVYKVLKLMLLKLQLHKIIKIYY